MDRIFWLGKLKDNSAVEIIPGSLVNTYFSQDVINFYEQKLRFINGEPEVVLRIQDIDESPYMWVTWLFHCFSWGERLIYELLVYYL